MKKLNVATLILLVVTLSSASNIGVIKNPKPNMTETKYVELVKVHESCDDIMDEEFIYKPFWVIYHREHLYVYDDLQARLFKLNQQLKIVKSYGRIGQGPGEFTRKRMPVLMEFGLDGKLYTNEVSAWKLMVLDENLEYLDEFKNRSLFSYFGKPVADARGTAYFLKYKDNRFTVRDQHNKTLFDFPVTEEDRSTLYYKKGDDDIPGGFNSYAMTGNSVLLFYIRNSSTLLTFKNNKLLKKMTLRPRDALTDYQQKLKKVIGHRGPSGRRFGKPFVAMFPWMFVDKDDGDVFYLDYVNNETKNIRALYQFSTEGKLLKVLYTKLKRPTTRFTAKGNHLYYGVEGEKIIAYKEKED